jgi:serine/threonine protein kinase
MNAEALIGTVLGTCTLERLVGQGGMGAVFLAQQSRPRRQVAVKVLLPIVPLKPHQLAAFMERFRRETDALASLEHPNIMPVHESGEQNGLAYLVMPYISGGTLRDEMEREGQLALEKVVNYLDQMAAALDAAHERGIIHRDIKPANILMTPEERLLLSDFGLVKIIAEGQIPQVRLTGEGVPVGTPDYMAPEQVVGEGVDTRADLYSLGVILYQMVTGTTPFQGETPMQIAAQHLQVPPPSPQLLRTDLPIAAEQVILRALAKRPDDRYALTQDLASAFRMSLMGTGIQLSTVYSGQGGQLSGMNRPRLFTPPTTLDSVWQTGTVPTVGNAGSARGGLLSKQTGTVPSLTTNAQPTVPVEGTRGGGLLSRTGKFPQIGTGGMPAMTAGNMPMTASTGKQGMIGGTGQFSPLLNMPAATGEQVAVEPPALEQMSPAFNTSGVLAITGQHGATNTMKLSTPVKIVKVPVVGQPGQYVTGLLPVAPGVSSAPHEEEKKGGTWVKLTSLALAVLLVALGMVGALWFVHTHLSQPANQPVVKHTTAPAGAPDLQATVGAQLTATTQANVILSDPLSQNVHNWLTSPADVYAFRDGAYHITDRGTSGRATVLQGRVYAEPLGYTLTIEEIAGDDTSTSNSFGMIIRFSQQTRNGKMVTTFYSFEVVNVKGGEYQFWKYDDSQTNSPWNEIWHQPFAGEFHQGHGPQSVNTVKIFATGKNFTFTVNGTLIKTIQDGSLTSGTIGMIVNYNGTEVAFKNLLLTRN